MRKELHAAVINCVLQDITDRSFLGGVKRCIDNMSEEVRNERDIKETSDLISRILDENITEKREVLIDVVNRNYSDDFRCVIDENSRYTRKYKRELLDLLNAQSLRSNVIEYVDNMVTNLEDIDYNTSNSKAIVKAVNDFMANLDQLHKTAHKSKITAGSSNILIMDPDEQTTHGTLDSTIRDLRESISNRIKTIPPIDMLTGGGVAPKTLTLFCAYTGHGKSMIMQNIVLFSSKNNAIPTFNVQEGLKPCIVFISLELTKKQLLERHLRWCGVNTTLEELKDATDNEINQMVLKANKNAGLQIPIMYIERLSGDMPTDIMDVEDEMNNCYNAGFQPVLTVIDYVDRLEVHDVKHRHYSNSGSEGSALLRQKGKECRELATRRNVPVITAAQLSGEVGNIISECEKHPKKIDVLVNVPQSCLAGSKYLGTEIELMVFCNKTEIEERSMDSDIVKKQHFLSMCVKKDRDHTAKYIRSERDKVNESAYLQYTKKLSVEPETKRFMSNAGEVHVCIPMESFKLSEDDYGRSIRMFYLGSENTSFQTFDASQNDDMEFALDIEQEEAIAKDALMSM